MFLIIIILFPVSKTRIWILEQYGINFVKEVFFIGSQKVGEIISFPVLMILFPASKPVSESLHVVEYLLLKNYWKPGSSRNISISCFNNSFSCFSNRIWILEWYRIKLCTEVFDLKLWSRRNNSISCFNNSISCFKNKYLNPCMV